MRVLGIDPGSINCGYGIVDYDGAQFRYVECGVLSANARHGKWQRIGELADDLRGVLSEHKWGLDDLCACESAYVPPGRTMGVETLAEARGALCCVAMQAGLSIVTVAPSTVKKAVTGHGHSDKAAVAAHLVLILGLKNTPANDASDALGVAIAAGVAA